MHFLANMILISLHFTQQYIINAPSSSMQGASCTYLTRVVLYVTNPTSSSLEQATTRQPVPCLGYAPGSMQIVCSYVGQSKRNGQECALLTRII